MTKLITFSDGGARGNPGPAGIGFVIYDEAGKLLYKKGAVLDFTTNNQAEYQALIAALKESKNLGATALICNLDSELVVKQLQGKYKIKEPGLQVLASEALRLTSKFASVEFVHVPREKNKLADELVNQALDDAGF